MTEITEIPSPFCGIGTDDLSIQIDGTQLTVTSNGCAVNTPAFEQAIGDSLPSINGQTATLEQAVAKAAEILRNTQQPVFGGCASDVNGMRALLALADKTGAVVDNQNFNITRRNLLAMQDSGWMNCTLAEIKNRCDLLLIVGTDVEGFAPRFFERYLWTEHAMFLDKPGDREVIYLGKAPSGSASTRPDGKVQSICSLVKDINLQGNRCSGFPLGGKEGDQTANQVCGWTTGYPARVNYARGFPEYDPFLYDTQTLLNNGEADALLWLQSFNQNSRPPHTQVPSIVLGRAGMQFDQAPAVYIPIGTPGIDHAGHAYRLDNVVAIRLKKLRDAGLPSSADVLSAIEHAL
ncbi:MAG: formylmethanofuran dehydrogenase subunit B [Methylococcaceae bacterium]|nr:formylmethanofuran dehydrogenase subunit B [Methylococcaceae bacterium]